MLSKEERVGDISVNWSEGGERGVEYLLEVLRIYACDVWRDIDLYIKRHLHNIQQWVKNNVASWKSICLSWVERRPPYMRRDGVLATARGMLAGDCPYDFESDCWFQEVDSYMFHAIGEK